ncbi:MAG: hypothetical protein ACYDAD_14095 [Acidimicrobiales bacterium]
MTTRAARSSSITSRLVFLAVVALLIVATAFSLSLVGEHGATATGIFGMMAALVSVAVLFSYVGWFRSGPRVGP